MDLATELRASINYEANKKGLGHQFRSTERQYRDNAAQIEQMMNTLNVKTPFGAAMFNKLNDVRIAFEQAAIMEEDNYKDRS